MSAAKQGLSAQISQASEDAKRAVLNRTSLTTSLWFSNLNTTCTIKSAPPRTPEVLSLLSTKSGWLFKRNEQHVWQTRWCCVVPHTFLYYFDANVLPGEAQPPVPSTAQQDDWNYAVANGYPQSAANKHKKKQYSAPRSSLYLGFGSTSNNNNAKEQSTSSDDPLESPTHGAAAVHNAQAAHPHPPPPHHHQGPTGSGGNHNTNNNNTSSSESFASLQPAGIIDLECYTSVHRSQQNQLVLELAGDDAVNPDLRQFYFCAGNETETEDWTQALLGQRHSALLDETEAYKQVCDGFAQQLQQLHMDMDTCQKQCEDAQEELYQVRSVMEEGRRSCWSVVEEILDKENDPTATAATATATDSEQLRSFRADLSAIRSQDISLLAPVQLLADYTRQLEQTCQELTQQNQTLQENMDKATDSDHDKVLQLEGELADVKTEWQHQQAQWQHEKQVLQQKLDKSTKELQDMNKDLASTRMEVTMYQSSTRNKITELQNHKKILKKEVIDLRQKLEDSLSELSLLKHKEKSSKLEVEQERQRAQLLERYVDKVEAQVKVQQNMMEMMSNSGVGSIHGQGGGGAGGSHYEVTVPHSVHSPSNSQSNNHNNNNNNLIHNTSSSAYAASPARRNILLVNTPSNVGDHEHDVDPNKAVDLAGSKREGDDHDDDDDDDEEEGPFRNHHHNIMHGSPSLRRAMLDDSDNKSHLSELTEDRTQKQFDAIHYLREQQQQHQQRYASPRSNNGLTTPPPAYIVGGGGNNNKGGSTTTDRFQHHQTQTASLASSPHQQQLLHNFQNPDQAKLDTIHSSATAVTTPSRMQPLVGPPRPSPRDRSTTGGDMMPPHQVTVDHHHQLYQQQQQQQQLLGGIGSSSRSLGANINASSGSHRLSVAQRSRMQADRGSTPVKVRLDQHQQQNNNNNNSQQHQSDESQSVPGMTSRGPPPTSMNNPSRMRGGVERRNSNSSQSRTGNFLSNIGRKLEAAIDKSVFSVEVHGDTSDDDGDDDDDDDFSSCSSRGHHHSDDGDDVDDDDRSSHNEENLGHERNPAAANTNRSSSISDDDNEGGKPPKSSSSGRAGGHGGGGPALLTRETLDGHNHQFFSKNEKTKRSTETKTSISTPTFGTPRRKDYAESTAGSSVVTGDEEKKTPTPDRIKNMSLAERQAYQRQKQLQFLKDQGLIKDETEIRGGAGASPSETGSVSSAGGAPAGSTVSFPGRLTPRRFVGR